MDAAELRPLSIGETLDVAIKIYRERFGNLVRAVVVVVGPIAVLSALVQASAFPDSNAFDTGTGTGSDSAFEWGEFWTFVAGMVVVGLLTFIAAEIATAASFKIVSGAYLNASPDWRESLRFAVSRLRSLLWLSLLTGFFLVLGFVACIVPGIYLYGAWAVAAPVLLLEGSRGTAALKRSRHLVKGRWWPTAAALLVSTLLAMLVQTMFSGLLLAAVRGGDSDVLEAVLGAIVDTAGSVLTTPFTAAVITVLYFDLRVRKEGFDLELLAHRVGIEPGPGARTDLLPPATPAGEGQPPFWPPPPGWRPRDG